MIDPIFKDIVSGKLTKLWKKFTPDQIAVFVTKLSPYPVSKVSAALEQFYANSRFAPKPRDILELLGATPAPHDVSIERTRSFADILRSQDPQAANQQDCYVLWCYHRTLWRKGRAIILGRRALMSPDELKTQLASNDARWARELGNQLVAHGYDVSHCDSVTSWINADPDSPSDGLRDLAAFLKAGALPLADVEKPLDEAALVGAI